MNMKGKTVVFLTLIIVLGFFNPLQLAMVHANTLLSPRAISDINVYVAVENGVSERDPAVAVCQSNQYLVVYEREGDIYGQRVTPSGALVEGAFIIFDGNYNAHDPAVACNWHNSDGVFVVVWSYDYYGDGSDYDIWGRLVRQNANIGEDETIGDPIAISQDASGVQETRPTVACNSDDDTCLVLFEYSGSGSGDIYGQRLNPNTGVLLLEGDRFQIPDYVSLAEGSPDVTWNSANSRFVVAWQSQINTMDYHNRILYTHIYDTEQGAGVNETYGSSYLLYNPGSGEDNYNAEHIYPSVAINPNNGIYMISFTVNASSYTKGYTVRTNATHSFSEMNLISNYANGRAVVAYSGGADILPGDQGKPEFMSAFLDTGPVGYLALFTGTLPDLPDSGGYTIFMDLKNLVDESLGWYYNVDIAGAYHSGKYFIVYEEETYAGGEYDIYGMIVEPLNYVYLPMMIR